MNTDFILLFISLLVNATTGAWILSKRPNMPVNRRFFAVVVVLSIWGFCEISVLLSSSAGQARFWDDISSIAGLFLPVFVTLFISAHFKEVEGTRSRFLKLFAAGSLLVAAAFAPVCIATDLIVKDVIISDGRFRFIAGDGYPFYAAFVLAGVIAPAGYSLARGFGAADKFLRRQAVIMGLSPIVPAAVYLILEAFPQVLGGIRVHDAYPFTVFFTIILGTASRKLDLMTVTPEKSSAEVLEAQPDAVLLIDRAGRIRYSNAAFSAITGLAPVAEAHADIRAVLRVKTKGLEDLFDRPFDGVPAGLSAECEMKSASGARIPARMSFRKLTGSPTEAKGAVLVLRDERPLRDIEAGLIHDEKIRSLGVMASGVAHEINNPLTAVIGYSELGSGDAAIAPDQARSFFRTIHQQAKRAHGIVRNLLEFAGASPSADSPVSVNEVVSNILSLRRHEIEGVMGHAVQANLAPDLPVTMSDPTKLRQVFFNVLDNAILAVGKAEGRGLIRIGTSERDGTITIAVGDTGPGIRPEIADRVFDPFFTTREPGKGTGLGLSIAKAHMDGIGGSIDFTTGPEKGTTFRINIPVVRPGFGAGGPAAASAAEAAMPGRNPRILVFDEDKVVAGMVSEILAAKGCSVANAGDEEALLGSVRAGGVDVLICGIAAGGTRCAAVREKLFAADRDLPKKMVILLDGAGPAEAAEFLARAGARIIRKPFRIPDLVDAVVSVLAEAPRPS